MDLQLLRAFLAVAETHSISKAAVQLGYSQPGLSHRIQVLERELGCTLFRRTSRGMTPTPEGQLLMPYARMTVLMMQDIDQTIAAFRAAQERTGTEDNPGQAAAH
ncbi:LysR family transcriptional regulator [Pedococcus sp. 5OH_020]|uniref:LysR family transcriptional regulator n=1 Tax=Pedococcus sp. 5OH_020 TaxID=2989814 RepID=UPI0022E9C5FF|nr:LysR family transcriptional regulator [Pedococcus sp. 5OH_020]